MVIVFFSVCLPLFFVFLTKSQYVDLAVLEFTM